MLLAKQYIKQEENPKWTFTEAISPYFTEPAKDISIITRGNFIYVNWRSLKKMTDTIMNIGEEVDK